MNSLVHNFAPNSNVVPFARPAPKARRDMTPLERGLIYSALHAVARAQGLDRETYLHRWRAQQGFSIDFINEIDPAELRGLVRDMLTTAVEALS